VLPSAIWGGDGSRGEPDEFSQPLTKAEASKRIDALKSRLERKRGT
jgi:hypothetical protein